MRSLRFREKSPIHARSTATHSITNARKSLAEEQSSRQKAYFWSMMLRTACFISAIFLHNPWRWFAIAGAVILPYISVVMANTVSQHAIKETSYFVPRKKSLGN